MSNWHRSKLGLRPPLQSELVHTVFQEPRRLGLEDAVGFEDADAVATGVPSCHTGDCFIFSMVATRIGRLSRLADLCRFSLPVLVLYESFISWKSLKIS